MSTRDAMPAAVRSTVWTQDRAGRRASVGRSGRRVGGVVRACGALAALRVNVCLLLLYACAAM